MGLNKRLIVGAGGGVPTNTDNFDVVTYTGVGGSFNIANGVEASVTINSGTANYALGSTTYGNNSGKHYFEVEYISANGAANTLMVGIINTAYAESWTNAQTKMYYAGNGNKYTGGGGTSYGATYAPGDIIGVAYDGTNRTVTFYKNNVSQGTAFTGLITNYPSYWPAIGTGLYSETAQFRFTSSEFTYTPPSGYSEWGSSTVSAISGTVNSAQAAQPIDFQPDLVWIKTRSTSNGHILHDSVRGVTKFLSSNSTGGEGTLSGYLDSFDSNGFTLGASSNHVSWNLTGDNYVAWCWKAGGTAVSNTNGSITSSVSANQDAGFSIVKYTGQGAARTVGHGLSATPEMVIIKNLDDARNWVVYHKDLSASSYAFLNLTNAEETDTRINGGQPRPFGPFTSTTFGVNIDNETGHTNNYIAYCFHSVNGYQKVGSYSGGTSGYEVTLDFTPRFVMIKETTVGSTGWVIVDSQRGSNELYAHASNVEDTTSTNIVLGTDKFTLNTTGTWYNASGRTYMYLAIA